jgi:outer membrane protein assembly factor BamA
VLVVVVAERPSISEINIDGNKAIETEALLDGLKGAGLAVGQVFQRSTLEGMQLELQRQYVTQGRYDAAIETEVIPEPRNRVAINIDVDEGTVAAIKHINVVGNSVFSDDELADVFELKTTGWFSFFTNDDKYSREKLTGDLEKLTSFYMDRGYLQFTIDSTQVSVSPDKERGLHHRQRHGGREIHGQRRRSVRRPRAPRGGPAALYPRRGRPDVLAAAGDGQRGLHHPPPGQRGLQLRHGHGHSRDR